jgi:hypothetical protein
LQYRRDLVVGHSLDGNEHHRLAELEREPAKLGKHPLALAIVRLRTGRLRLGARRGDSKG